MGLCGCFGGGREVTKHEQAPVRVPNPNGAKQANRTYDENLTVATAVPSVSGKDSFGFFKRRSSSFTSMQGDNSHHSSLMKEMEKRRHAVFTMRSSIVQGASSLGGAMVSTERRLPADGGPSAPRAHSDVSVIQKACEGISLFQGLHEDDRKELYQSMYLLEYQPQQDIIRQGEEGRNFYVIFQGAPTVKVENEKKDVVMEKVLHPGDTFGEVALLHSCPRSATVTCGNDSRVKVWALDRVTFSQLLSNSAFNRRKRYVELLKNVEPLKKLAEYNIMLLADALESRSFVQGEKIVVQGQAETSGFHIIEKGSVSVWLDISEREVNKLTKGDYFGEVTLLREGDIPTATVVAETTVDTLTLSNASFYRLLGEDVRKTFEGYMQKYAFDESEEKADARTSSRSGGQTSHDNSFRSLSEGQPYVNQPVDGGTILIDETTQRDKDIDFLKELGLGMSGTAYLCQHKTYKTLVVVKMMKKHTLIRMNQVENVMRERAIIHQFDSPFLVPGYGSFQDKQHLYLAMEYMPGGELFRLLVEKKKLEVAAARFYAAEILLAVEYIHKKGHVYRDLKPENVLLDERGNCKLADLGFCKPLKRGAKTYTTCGTTDYMSPEIMLSKGHDRATDLWSFGILIFEMLAGFAPFESSSENVRYQKILSAEITYPDDFNLLAKDIVSRLCTVDVSKRLGNTVLGIEEVKQHMFFSGLDWRAIEEKRTRPPFTPRQMTAQQTKALVPMRYKEETGDQTLIKTALQKLFEGY